MQALQFILTVTNLPIFEHLCHRIFEHISTKKQPKPLFHFIVFPSISSGFSPFILLGRRIRPKPIFFISFFLSITICFLPRLQFMLHYLDLPKGVYSNWKAGKSRNFCEHLGAISKFLNVSAEYLVTGKDAEKNMENPREIELLNWYRKLTPEKQDAIRQMAKLLAE